jgi:hypothetical protein
MTANARLAAGYAAARAAERRALTRLEEKEPYGLTARDAIRLANLRRRYAR